MDEVNNENHITAVSHSCLLASKVDFTLRVRVVQGGSSETNSFRLAKVATLLTGTIR